MTVLILIIKFMINNILIIFIDDKHIYLDWFGVNIESTKWEHILLPSIKLSGDRNFFKGKKYFLNITFFRIAVYF